VRLPDFFGTLSKGFIACDGEIYSLEMERFTRLRWKDLLA
jgi:hypothetical protein